MIWYENMERVDIKRTRKCTWDIHYEVEEEECKLKWYCVGERNKCFGKYMWWFFTKQPENRRNCVWGIYTKSMILSE